jgi:mannose-6-phosphate isomerase-like protein (cupin superfamily)
VAHVDRLRVGQYSPRVVPTGPTARAGRLAREVPDAGEAFHALVDLGGARIEHIVSSDSPDPAEQVQAWDEWVLVVSGRARLGLPDGELELGPGDWVTIPAHTPHRVLATTAGTHWIAVHALQQGAREPAPGGAAGAGPGGAL